ncbi:nucleoside diphosphate kinase [Cenarchaeum symbiosum A]|uniref:nucleoside-diphosphate kinase n=1 Tax=Cenarchaeum symbiosum (strain A) TaxID=414004 RepID=A0RUB7_CENSY|nr:nucleoside diphosphate kinase [Cenarchaeum symbiosum A]
MFRFTKEQAEEFYAVHKERPFFNELVSFITSGSVVAAVIEGNNAVTAVRTMIGSTKSSEAAPGSIRGDLGLGFTDNIVHASDSAESFSHEERVAFQ